MASDGRNYYIFARIWLLLSEYNGVGIDTDPFPSISSFIYMNSTRFRFSPNRRSKQEDFLADASIRVKVRGLLGGAAGHY